jgi:hypothetical protein
MVYNPNQEGIDGVRTATGNLLPADYTDANITKKLSSAYGKIQFVAKRLTSNPFASGTAEADYAAQIELNLAAMWALKPYGPEFLDKIKELSAEVKDDLTILAGGITVTDEDIDIEEIIERTEFKSWIKNTTLRPPNRMNITNTRVESNF